MVYEIDKQTKMQTDAFSYLKCGEDYSTSQKMDTNQEWNEENIRYDVLFDNCFDNESNTEENHNANKKYTITVKFLENEINGKQIRNNLTPKAEELNRSAETIYEFKAIRHERDGNVYEPVAIITDSEVVIEKNNTKNADGTYTFYVKKLPNDRNVTIPIVYTVEK